MRLLTGLLILGLIELALCASGLYYYIPSAGFYNGFTAHLSGACFNTTKITCIPADSNPNVYTQIRRETGCTLGTCANCSMSILQQMPTNHLCAEMDPSVYYVSTTNYNLTGGVELKTYDTNDCSGAIPATWDFYSYAGCFRYYPTGESHWWGSRLFLGCVGNNSLRFIDYGLHSTVCNETRQNFTTAFDSTCKLLNPEQTRQSLCIDVGAPYGIPSPSPPGASPQLQPSQSVASAQFVLSAVFVIGLALIASVL